MSRFRPTCSSPILKPTAKASAVDLAKELLDDSRTSTMSIPELTGLTAEEVDFIDAVIQRAPANAATFLTVFKAYNDILQERGLDPQNEVVYYGKLLKLGTIRGKNWAEKWESVKEQQGYKVGSGSGRRTTRVSRHGPTPTKILTRLTTGIVREQPEDTVTLHSYPDDSESVEADEDAPSETDDFTHHDTPRPKQRYDYSNHTTATNSLGLHTGPAVSISNKAPSRFLTNAKRPPLTMSTWDDQASDVTDDTECPSSTIPPSYAAATRDTPFSHTPRITATPQQRTPTSRAASASPLLPPSTAYHAPLYGNERRKSVIDENDAWKKVREEQDCREADRFREDKLLERCWEVWKQGYQWIVTTHEQIAHARDTLILRLALHRWRQRTASYQELYARVADLSNKRRMKAALQLWKVKLKEKKQADWRNSMRARMKLVRERTEAKMVKDAWAKWRQSYRSHIAEQHYLERLVIRCFNRWKKRLILLDQLDVVADRFADMSEDRQVKRCWKTWRHATELQHLGKVMAERVDIRIMGDALDVWKRRLHQNRVADRVHDLWVMKRALGAWKAARDRIRALENRAAKHIARQDDLLVRAVMRVWKAHVRGRLLEQYNGTRLLKQALSAWQRRLQQKRDLEDLALAFATRSSSTLVSGSLQKWKQVYASHQNAQSFAAIHYDARLRQKTFLIWHLRLKKNLWLLKQARLAHEMFLKRKYLEKWTAYLAQRKLGKKLKRFETYIAQKYFLQWKTTAQRQRQRKEAEAIIRERVQMRIMSNALAHWVNRVIAVKVTELTVADQYEKRIRKQSFRKWRTCYVRHIEGLRLMESYQDVKREENKRRLFYKWLAAARKARHRRLYLQQKEEELQTAIVAATWDKWRERFLDIRLQPLADDFLIQKQKNIMFRAFGIWHSKTRSLPAVRFHALHTKAKAWKIWRNAMPRALQAKTAREMDRENILIKAFAKWQKAYKTKIELKAIARARYLRLPTAAPRQVIEHPRPSAISQWSRSALSSKAPRPSVFSEQPVSDSKLPPSSSPFEHTGTGTSVTNLLYSKSRSPERPSSKVTSELRSLAGSSRPKLSTRGSSTRASSPAPSVSTLESEGNDDFPTRCGPSSSVPKDEGRQNQSSLWRELRDMKVKPRPLSTRSRSREPT